MRTKKNDLIIGHFFVELVEFLVVLNKTNYMTDSIKIFIGKYYKSYNFK